MNDQVMPESRRSWWPWVLAGLIIAGIVYWLWGNNWQLSGTQSTNYQAVFLTNDQVYFGKLSQETSAFARLDDVFYLQVTQPLQPSDPQSKINLVKLGNELHGPINKMKINRDHILFIEELRPDSQVATAIAKLKKDEMAAAQP